MYSTRTADIVQLNTTAKAGASHWQMLEKSSQLAHTHTLDRSLFPSVK